MSKVVIVTGASQGSAKRLRCNWPNQDMKCMGFTIHGKGSVIFAKPAGQNEASIGGQVVQGKIRTI